MITNQQFRQDYPEFSDCEVYTDSQVRYWSKLAYAMLNASRWGHQLDLGAELFIAHNIVLERRAQATASSGGIPGESQGPISSKTVDKVSVSYDTASAMEPDAGHWNLTIYGTRFIRLVKMFGAGPIQVGVGWESSGAWSGPNTSPGFTNF